MPFIEVKSIRNVFSAEEKTQIVKEVTDIFGRLRGNEFADGTWVVISEIEDGHWGEGGVILYKDEVPTAANA
jgi:4-oxalocrotonate tautomerase